MAWSFVAASSAVASGANPAPAIPTGYAANDVLIIVATSTTAFSATPPTGYTQLVRQTAAPMLTVWWKNALSSESAPTCTNADASSKAVIVAYRSLNNWDATSTVASVSGTSLATTTYTAAVAGELGLSIYGGGKTSSSSSNWTAPGSTTARANSGMSTTLTGMLVCDEIRASAGTSTARTATVNRSVALNAVGIGFKLGTAFSGAIAEAASAADASAGGFTYSNLLVDNALGAAIVNAANSGLGANGGNGIGNSFIAQNTGVVGVVQLSLQRITGGTAIANGAIEIWQLASNVTSALPTTLLGSVMLVPTTVPTTITLMAFDFTSQNITLVAGTAYAVFLRSAAGWNYPTTVGIYIEGDTTSEPLYGGAVASMQSTGAGAGNNISPYIFRMAIYDASTDAPSWGMAGSNVEAVTAADSPDTINNAWNPALIEAATAADAKTGTYAPQVDRSETAVGVDTLGGSQVTYSGVSESLSNNEIMDTLGSSWGGPWVKFLNTASTIYGYGECFTAGYTGQLGIVSFTLYRNAVSSPPSQPGTVELWTAAGSPPTPQTKLAALPFAVNSVPAGGSINSVDFTRVVGAAIAAGSVYAIVIYRGSDWTGAVDTIGAWGFAGNLVSGISSTWNSNGAGWYGDTGSGSITPGFLVGYPVAQDPAVAVGPDRISHTEAAVLEDTADVTSGQLQFETVSGSEAVSALGTTYNDQSESVHGQVAYDWTALIDRGSFSYYATYGDAREGMTFQATALGVAGVAAFVFSLNQSGLPAVSTQGAIELWDTQGPDPTYIPNVMLGSIGFSLPSLSTTAARYTFDFTSQAISLVAGNWYWLGFRTGTDWIYNVNQNLSVKYANFRVSPATTRDLYNDAGAGWYISSTYSVYCSLQLAGNADTLVGNWATPATGTEAATAGTAHDGVRLFSPSSTEAGTMVAVADGIATMGVVMPEAATGTATMTGVAVYPQTIAESNAGADAPDGTLVTSATDSEAAAAATAQDGVNIFSPSSTETGSLMAVVDGIATMGVAMPETAAGTATMTGIAAYQPAMAESSTGNDAPVGIATMAVAESEPATATDQKDVAYRYGAWEPASPTDTNSVLTLPLDGTTEDYYTGTAAGYIQNSGAGYDTAHVKFATNPYTIKSTNGAAATVYYPTDVSRLPARGLLGNVWTLEFWWYCDVDITQQSSVATAMLYVAYAYGPPAGYICIGRSAGYPYAAVSLGTTLSTISAPSVSANTWHHICFQCDGSNAYLFIDGAPTYLGAVGATSFTLRNGDYLLWDYLNTLTRNAWISNLRLSKVARYATGGFTPPSAAFTGNVGTVSTSDAAFLFPMDKTESVTGAETPTGLYVFAQTRTEAVAAADVPAGVYAAAVAAADAAAVVDAMDAAAVLAAVGAETATGTDSPGSTMSAPADRTEAAAGADAPTSTSASPQAINEIGTGTDTGVGANVASATEAEATTAADLPAGAAVLVSVESESLSAVDSPVSAFMLGASDTEVATGGDLPVAVATLVSTLTESGSLADATSGIGPESAGIAEVVTAADSGTTSGVQPVAIPEASSAVDSPTSTYATSLVESEAAAGFDATVGLDVTEAAALELAMGLTTGDSANASSAVDTETAIAAETVIGTDVADAAIVESATVADVLAAAATFMAAQGESASSADTVIAAVSFVSFVTEAMAAGGSASVSAAMVSAITEAIAVYEMADGVGPQAVTIGEPTVGADLALAAATFVGVAMEVLAALDTKEAVNVSAIAAQLEAAPAMDTQAALALFVAALTEATTGADVPDAVAAFYADMASASTATDTVHALAAFVGAAVEAVSGGDTVSAFWIACASLTESSTVADAIDLMGLFVGAVAESTMGADIGGAWTGVTRAMLEAAAGVDAESALMVGVGTQVEEGTSTGSPTAFAVLLVADAEAMDGADMPAAVFVSPQAVAELSGAADDEAGQLAAAGASDETTAAVDAEFTTMVSTVAVGEVGFAADASASAVTFNIVIAEVGAAGDNGLATFISVAAAVEAVAGLDLPSVLLSAAAEIVVATSAADWLGATAAQSAAADELAVAVEEAEGQAGQWVGIYEVVSAVGSEMVALTQLAFGLEEVDASGLLLADANFFVGALEYVVAVDIGTGFVWVFDRRYVVPGVGRRFAVKRGAMSSVSMQPRRFDVVDAAPDLIDLMAARNFEVSR